MLLAWRGVGWGAGSRGPGGRHGERQSVEGLHGERGMEEVLGGGAEDEQVGGKTRWVMAPSFGGWRAQGDLEEAAGWKGGRRDGVTQRQAWLMYAGGHFLHCSPSQVLTLGPSPPSLPYLESRCHCASGRGTSLGCTQGLDSITEQLSHNGCFSGLVFVVCEC